MKSALPASLGLLRLAAAHPAPLDPPIRILPHHWNFNITSLKGPGCPDFGVPDGVNAERHTRPTFGENTVDGSEIYYWFLAYPSLHVELGKTESVWCETEVLYTEFGDPTTKLETEDYRLRLHKNGTKLISTYDLDKDVKATVTFTYLDFDVTDKLALEGPAESGQYAQNNDLVGSDTDSPHKVSKCGSATLKFRTEVTVEGGGQKGLLGSESAATSDAGVPQYYGTQLGFSYDWETC
ncbi:hypothetical protein F5Y18DRAFT_73498 [Xylariaceae sp. FL1019]|nr:hypothetical protein F5Y18DRAFT_73498 [Xylariaceae sp. FL1019]